MSKRGLVKKTTRMLDQLYRITSRFFCTYIYELKLGKGAVVYSPRKIDGGWHIEIGDNTTVSNGAWLGTFEHFAGQSFSPHLVIGSNVYIGHYACITCVSNVHIGDGCVLSEFVYISDHSHGFEPEDGFVAKQPLVSKGGVHIGAHTFIGYQACVLPGGTLGQHCVVGANSVVTHSFPDYSMVAGVPARLIKRYSFERRSWIGVDEVNRE